MTTHAASETWTTRRLLSWMGEAFTKKNLDSPRLMAEMLMAHVIGCERLKLYTDPDRPASDLERETLRTLVGRALKHEPVQYLVGEGWFFGLPFKVDKRVLVPRPCTETIVEHVLQHVRVQPGSGGPKGEGLLIADVCTGSGCIAISLLKRLPGARVIATDISADALEVAKENAVRHGVIDRLELLQGDLLQPLLAHPITQGDATLNYLISNPPYIPDSEWPAVEPNVKDHEPHLALRGGPDGLDFVRPLLAAGPRLLKPSALMLIEVADARAEQAKALAAQSDGLESCEILRDHEGLRRVVVARKKSHQA